MNIFVGCLSRRVSERELWDVFEHFGLVESVEIMMDRDTGQPRGCAFIAMTREAEAEAAIRGLDGRLLGDRVLHVTRARPRENVGFRRPPPHASHRTKD